MFKYVKYGLVILGLLFSTVTQAQQCLREYTNKDGVRICDVSFTAIPTFGSLCVGAFESGLYTITNNTPVTIALNYIRVASADALPAVSSAIIAAPTNPCGASLASGASCNILLNLQPLGLGTFSRTLQVGIDTRQAQITSPTISTAVNCIPGAPGAPAAPTIPGTPGSLFLASIIGNTTITNTGPSVVNGDVDLNSPPGVSITGFPPGTIVNGAQHIGGIANTAHSDAATYFGDLNALTCPPGNNLTGQDLGGKTLAPGVYCFDTSAALTGPIPLTLAGPAGSSFTFKIGTTLITGSNTNVVLGPGISNANVNWAVGTSATLGTFSHFEGIIDAGVSITLTTGVSLSGRAWALTGAVSLDSNAVNPTAP